MQFLVFEFVVFAWWRLLLSYANIPKVYGRMSVNLNSFLGIYNLWDMCVTFEVGFYGAKYKQTVAICVKTFGIALANSLKSTVQSRINSFIKCKFLEKVEFLYGVIEGLGSN